jgi:serine/threonine protein kinase
MQAEESSEIFVYDSTKDVPRDVERVKIASSVAEIEYGAFKNCSQLEAIDFSGARALQTIGEDAFYHCSALKAAKFPPSLKVIAKEAFQNCYGLEDIDFSEAEALETIGYHSFFKCSSLKDITFPPNLKVITTRAFRYCGFTRVDFSQAVGLERIEESTFSRCASLQEVKFPPNLKVIRKTAFQYCGFTDVDFSQKGSLERIEEEAFMDCSALKVVKISPNLQVIAKGAFKNCYELQAVDFSQAVALKRIEEEAFARCASLEQVKFPPNLQAIAKGAFERCQGLEDIDFSEAVALESIGEKSFLNCSSVETVKFPPHLKSIAKGAYQRCEKLEEIDFSHAKTLEAIGEGVFSNCLSLKVVKLPPSLKVIESGAFGSCHKLHDINFSEAKALEAIGKNSLYRCSSLKEVKFPSNLWVIAKGAFEQCIGLEEIDFSEASVLQRIGANAFMGCNSLKALKFPQSLNLISKGAFEKCENLIDVDFSEAKALETIGELAFYGCESLEEVILLPSLKVIENGAFKQCGRLHTVKLNGPLERIGDMAFYGCESLKDFEASSTEYTGADAFCFSGSYTYTGAGEAPRDLIHLKIARNISRIDDIAFQRCKRIRDIDFTEADSLEIIGEFAFSSCVSLKEVRFPPNINTIEKLAFESCIGLEDVDFIDAKALEMIRENAFIGCNSLKGVIFSANLNVIEYGAFEECSQLEDIDFSGTKMLETIGDSVFARCESLKKVLLPATVTSFGDDVFSECPILNYIAINGDNLALAIRIHLLYPTQTKDTITTDKLVDLYSFGPIKERELLTNKEAERQKLRETKAAYVYSIVTSPPGDDFSVRKQHGWVHFLANHVGDDSKEADSLIDFFHTTDLKTLRVLANAKDRDGRIALKFAKSRIRETFEERLLFLGRYDLAKGPQIHKSTTCIVVKAEDYKMNQYYESKFVKHKSGASSALNMESFCRALQDIMLVSKDLDENDMKMAKQYFARADVDRNNAVNKEEFVSFCLDEFGRTVALKFMRKRDQFHRELEARNDMDNKYIVKVIQSHDSSEIEAKSLVSFVGRHLSDDEGNTTPANKPEAYCNVLAMPYGDRNLDAIFRSERPDMVTVRKLMKEVGEALACLHENGLVHGDLKMPNVVRINNQLCLIDFDASARVGIDFVGCKFSSGVLPPEMIYCLADFGEKQEFVDYFANDTLAEQEKREPQFSSNPKKGYVVRTFLQQELVKEKEDPETGEMIMTRDAIPSKDGIPFEMVVAKASLDVWSFGVLLYAMCVGCPLFPTDRDDDIKDGNVLRRLCDWTEDDIETHLENVIRDSYARGLLEQILQRNPDDRPTIKQVLAHTFFHPGKDQELSRGALGKVEKIVREEGKKSRMLVQDEFFKTNESLSRSQHAQAETSKVVRSISAAQEDHLVALEEVTYSIHEAVEAEAKRIRKLLKGGFSETDDSLSQTQKAQAAIATMLKNSSTLQAAQINLSEQTRSTIHHEAKETRATVQLEAKEVRKTL